MFSESNISLNLFSGTISAMADYKDAVVVVVPVAATGNTLVMVVAWPEIPIQT
jgi:hypothetical protein